MNYTKGEWAVTPAGNVVVDGRLIVRTPVLTDNDNEALANTNLIAAAPDMYEALKEMIGAEDSIPEYMAKVINVALAKAEGKC